jgi:hypothetical protein
MYLRFIREGKDNKEKDNKRGKIMSCPSVSNEIKRGPGELFLLNQPLENKGPLFQVDVDFVKKTDQCRK